MDIQEILKTHQKIYILNISLPGAGFGAILLTTLNQFRYCERENYYPVVNYDHTCNNAFFDQDYGDNLWEQYFELPGDLTYQEVKEALAKGIIAPKDCLTLPDDEMLRISEEHPESIYTFTFGKWRFDKPKDLLAWYNKQRQRGRETVTQYVQLKPHIREKVETFYAQYFGDTFVLGLHIRGTDLHYAPPVSPAEYFPHIDDFISKHSDLRLFLATDQKQYVDVFQQRYPNRVFYSDAFRSDNEVAIFDRKEISPYQKGEEVLLDILLLSKTDYLLKGASNVGEFAMYFNPSLECHDLSLSKDKAYGQDYGAGWDNISIDPAWKLVRNTDLSKVDKHAQSQNILQKTRMQLRYMIRHTLHFFGKRLKGQ